MKLIMNILIVGTVLYCGYLIAMDGGLSMKSKTTTISDRGQKMITKIEQAGIELLRNVYKSISSPQRQEVLLKEGERLLKTWWIFIVGVVVAFICRVIGPLGNLLTYAQILEHELTHLLFGAMAGGSFHALTVTRNGGAAAMTKFNTAATLAPYFFPLFAIVFSLLACLLSYYRSFFMACAGFCYGNFLSGLKSMHRQPDIQEKGGFKAYPLIFAGHSLILCFMTVILDKRILSALRSAL